MFKKKKYQLNGSWVYVYIMKFKFLYLVKDKF